MLYHERLKPEVGCSEFLPAAQSAWQQGSRRNTEAARGPSVMLFPTLLRRRAADQYWANNNKAKIRVRVEALGLTQSGQY